MYTVEDAFEILKDYGFTRDIQGVRRWIRGGQIKAEPLYRRNDGYLISDEALFAFIEERAPGIVKLMKENENLMIENSKLKKVLASNFEGFRDITHDAVGDNDLINEYQSMCEQMNKVATIKDLKENTRYSYDVYRQHFGTISNLRKRAGLSMDYYPSAKSITKTDCVEELLKIYREKGRLSYTKLKKESTISMSTIFRKFGTTRIDEVWDEVIRER